MGVLAHVKTEKDAVEALLEPADMVERLLQDMQSLRPQVEELEYKLDSRGQGVGSVEEIKLEINSLQSKRYSIWLNLGALTVPPFWGSILLVFSVVELVNLILINPQVHLQLLILTQCEFMSPEYLTQVDIIRAILSMHRQLYFEVGGGGVGQL